MELGEFKELFEEAIKKNILPKNKPVKIHIKLDTGMHRLGFEEKDIDKLSKQLEINKSIYVQSIFSHLAASEDPAHDDFTNLQISLFKKMSDLLKSKIDHPVLLHILNSAGINRFPSARFDMVRIGISLYGIALDRTEQNSLENVSTLKSSISQIKNIPAKDTIGYNRKGVAKNDMVIAIVPIGYADGLSRKLGNRRGKLFVNGKSAYIVGNVCMDMCMIDITDIQAKEGDEVIIFGDNNPIQNIAKDMDTIPYEILTGISRRVKRIYFHE